MKLIYIFIVVFHCFFLSHGISQEFKEEYYQHIYSIDTSYKRLLEGVDRFHTTNANLALVQYVVSNKLNNSSEIKYISNRALLKQIPVEKCDTTGIYFSGVNDHKDTIKLNLKINRFEESKNLVVKDSSGYCCESINGKYPYGGEYSMPDIYIHKIELTLNNETIIIPDSAYNNLYNINLCSNRTNTNFERGVELYTSLNGDYIYLYIYGGNAASTYFTKLIFDKEKSKFIKRVVLNYRELSETHSFRKDFIGF